MRTDDAPEPRQRPDPRIGAAIKAKRTMLRLSQRKLGEAIGRSRSHISNVERGEDGAGAEMLVKISKELDISLDELLKSPSPGTPGTHTITVTEEEIGVVVAIRGLPEDLRAPIIKTLLRAGADPKAT